jgi:hypothetical protein
MKLVKEILQIERTWYVGNDEITVAQLRLIYVRVAWRIYARASELPSVCWQLR